MSCDKKVPRQALGGELGLAGNFPPHATVITNALQSPTRSLTWREDILVDETRERRVFSALLRNRLRLRDLDAPTGRHLLGDSLIRAFIAILLARDLVGLAALGKRLPEAHELMS